MLPAYLFDLCPVKLLEPIIHLENLRELGKILTVFDIVRSGYVGCVPGIRLGAGKDVWQLSLTPTLPDTLFHSNGSWRQCLLFLQGPESLGEISPTLSVLRV